MIVCTVCQHPNHHLAIVCASCGAYVQAKVDNLDLFRTAWEVLERPFRAFHLIAVARHKNYVVFLAALAGVALAFGGLWLARAGDLGPGLFVLIAGGTVGGLVLGVVVVLVYALLLSATARLLRHRARFRNVFAVVAYATIPLTLSALLVLPVEILTFGQYLFTRAPSAYFLKPVSFVALSILDGLFAVWTIFLVVTAVRVLLDVGWGKALIVALASLVVLAGAAACGLLVFLSSYAPRGV